jgi:hypothetical protein
MKPAPTAGTAIELHEQHEPHWISRIAFPVLTALLFLTQVALGFAVYRGNYWLAVPLVLISSHLMHGIVIGFHEATHGLLRKNRLLNEIDGLIIGTLSLMSFSLYRAAHQLHHAYLASERDEELWPFVHLPRSAGWRGDSRAHDGHPLHAVSIRADLPPQGLTDSKQETPPAHLDGVRGHGGRLDCDPHGGHGL